MAWFIRCVLAAAAAALVAALVADAADARPANVSAEVRNASLVVTATGSSPRITLRLAAHAPGKLEIDAGDDGVADYRFDRRRLELILVDAGPGNGLVRIDESNGVFTNTIPILIECRTGRQHLVQASPLRFELTAHRRPPACVAQPRVEQLLRRKVR